MIVDVARVERLVDQALGMRTNDNEAIVLALCAIAVALTPIEIEVPE